MFVDDDDTLCNETPHEVVCILKFDHDSKIQRSSFRIIHVVDFDMIVIATRIMVLPTRMQPSPKHTLLFLFASVRRSDRSITIFFQTFSFCLPFESSMEHFDECLRFCHAFFVSKDVKRYPLFSFLFSIRSSVL